MRRKRECVSEQGIEQDRGKDRTLEYKREFGKEKNRAWNEGSNYRRKR